MSLLHQLSPDVFAQVNLLLDGRDTAALMGTCRALYLALQRDQLAWRARYCARFPSDDDDMDWARWFGLVSFGTLHRHSDSKPLRGDADWYYAYRERLRLDNNWKRGNCLKKTFDSILPDKSAPQHALMADGSDQANAEAHAALGTSEETPAATHHWYIPACSAFGCLLYCRRWATNHPYVGGAGPESMDAFFYVSSQAGAAPQHLPLPPDIHRYDTTPKAVTNEQFIVLYRVESLWPVGGTIYIWCAESCQLLATHPTGPRATFGGLSDSWLLVLHGIPEMMEQLDYSYTSHQLLHITPQTSDSLSSSSASSTPRSVLECHPFPAQGSCHLHDIRPPADGTFSTTSIVYGCEFALPQRNELRWKIRAISHNALTGQLEQREVDGGSCVSKLAELCQRVETLNSMNMGGGRVLLWMWQVRDWAHYVCWLALHNTTTNQIVWARSIDCNRFTEMHGLGLIHCDQYQRWSFLHMDTGDDCINFAPPPSAHYVWIPLGQWLLCERPNEPAIVVSRKDGSVLAELPVMELRRDCYGICSTHIWFFDKQQQLVCLEFYTKQPQPSSLVVATSEAVGV
ncbi:hypothetical protein THASP1DRAFT_31799 [Thamnocephalis sphaerospora]|uniref:F-box domain-containing protein n=1 Tax=Thamnocephalis sphaerospora TaxID=78915 RepID=A0A4P9XKQ2_9FUNG|nr:hypothetical protein THASP1DRAFT_31799 [Thamnocephalis sphaerospora]|eukprot:RKP06387.1 hypothetical protein THASP1DRAFT_31799 [Thamnocephalis sphaerospora]